jgi:hypothetical protein
MIAWQFFTRIMNEMFSVMTPRVVDIHERRGKHHRFDIYIGRRVRLTRFTEDSKWCNPFRVDDWNERTIPLFTAYARILATPMKILESVLMDASITYRELTAIARAVERARRRWGKNAWNLNELTGKTLGCWCKDKESCHGTAWIALWQEIIGNNM